MKDQQGAAAAVDSVTGPDGKGMAEPRARAVGTRERLLKVAQDAIADLGVNGASLRRISELSGSRNVMAAQYHFGSRDALVAAIIDANRERLEVVRTALLGGDATALAGMTVQDLFLLVIKPLVDDCGTKEDQSFVRFLRSLLQHSPYYELWADRQAKAPVTRAIYDALRHSVRDLPERAWRMRMTLIGKLVIEAVGQDDPFEDDGVAADADAFLADLVEMAAAVLLAPTRMTTGTPANRDSRSATPRPAAKARRPRGRRRVPGPTEQTQP